MFFLAAELKALRIGVTVDLSMIDLDDLTPSQQLQSMHKFVHFEKNH
jgi:hypothetical protein